MGDAGNPMVGFFVLAVVIPHPIHSRLRLHVGLPSTRTCCSGNCELWLCMASS